MLLSEIKDLIWDAKKHPMAHRPPKSIQMLKEFIKTYEIKGNSLQHKNYSSAQLNPDLDFEEFISFLLSRTKENLEQAEEIITNIEESLNENKKTKFKKWQKENTDETIEENRPIKTKKSFSVLFKNTLNHIAMKLSSPRTPPLTVTPHEDPRPSLFPKNIQDVTTNDQDATSIDDFSPPFNK